MLRRRFSARAALLALVSAGCQIRATAPVPAVAIEVHGSATDAPASPEGAATDAYADDDPSALLDFRATLGAHGLWVEDPAFGTVWVPARDEVGPGFVPYATAGHWVYEDDYVWISDYSWGWIPFHYGRWVLIAGRGWAWIPGRVYANAWVVWRLGDDDLDYVGWAPMPPAWIWRDGVAVSIRVAPAAPYVYVPRREVFAPRVWRRVVRGPAVADIERRSRPYPPRTAVVGPLFAPPEHVAPPLSHLRIAPSAVPRPDPGDEGLHRAHQYAAPATAQRLGARPPTVLRAPAVSPPSSRPPLGRALPQRESPIEKPPLPVPKPRRAP